MPSSAAPLIQLWQFFFPQEIKSFITRPSPGLTLKGPGFYEISGLAYSGNGPINKVEVSADGGKSWALAVLDARPEQVVHAVPHPLELEWSPAILQSRATDEAGNVQPTRAALVTERGESKTVPPVTAVLAGHFNAITSWATNPNGEVSHVYA